LNDNPISSRGEDDLHRARFADNVASALRTLDVSHGATVAVLGPWGVGKTSLLNLIVENLAGPPRLLIIQFNPWLFSGTEQLVASFFAELASQLRVQLGTTGKLADRLEAYGQALAPLAFLPALGPWLGRAGSLATTSGRLARRRAAQHEGVTAQREHLQRALAKLENPIVVVVDDIDRLQPQEIRDILRLVKLTANFPKVIYLLAFDRQRVEQALDQEGFEGRAYLEKIVQVTYNVPPVPEAALSRILVEGLDEAIKQVNTGPFDEALWIDVFHRAVRPLFSNLRDVKRYLAALPATLRSIGEEVALVDVLALEALRVLAPDAHAQLGPTAVALTETRPQLDQRPQHEAELTALIDAGGPASATVTELCRLLFPASQHLLGGTPFGPEWLGRWRRDRRVAHPAVLGFYLTRVLSPGVAPASVVALVFDALTEPAAAEARLRRLLAELPDDVLADVLERLEAYEEAFPAEAGEPASAVLLELYPRLRRHQPGSMDPGPDSTIDRLVLDLLRRVTDTAALTGMVARLCERDLPLNSRLRLVELVDGHQEDLGARLVPLARLRGGLCERIRHAPAGVLATEQDLLRLLVTALRDRPEDRCELDRELDDPVLLLAVLRDALAEVTTQPVGSVAGRRDQLLHWEPLVAVMGDERQLARRLASLQGQLAELDEPARRAIDLAQRHLQGWRPNRRTLPQYTLIGASHGPRSTLSPTVGEGWPDLVLRAVQCYRLESSQAQQATIGSQFRRDLEQTLGAGPLPKALGELVRRRGGTPPAGEWEPDPEAYSTTRATVMTLRLGQQADGQPALQARCAVVLPDMQSNVLRVIVDLYLRMPELTTLTQPSVEQASQPTNRAGRCLSLAETAQLLETCLEVAAEDVPAQFSSLLGTSYAPARRWSCILKRGGPIPRPAVLAAR
jgi:KAP family P-loop domain